MYLNYCVSELGQGLGCKDWDATGARTGMQLEQGLGCDWSKDWDATGARTGMRLEQESDLKRACF